MAIDQSNYRLSVSELFAIIIYEYNKNYDYVTKLLLRYVKIYLDFNGKFIYLINQIFPIILNILILILPFSNFLIYYNSNIRDVK